MPFHTYTHLHEYTLLRTNQFNKNLFYQQG